MVANRFLAYSSAFGYRLAETRTQGPLVRLYRVRGLLLVLLFLTSAMVNGEETLQASIDQTEIHENETLTLTVKGRTELDLSLGALMNLKNLELPEPDLGKLRESFDILDQRQAYSLQSINGKHTAEVTWTYQLAPRQAGMLTIPSMTFKDAQSEPIRIDVKPGSASQAENRDRPAWIEAGISKDQAFVQEQLVYTLKLYYEGSLVGGDLTEPQVEDAIIEPLGEQTQTSEFIAGKRYQVVERDYLVYPQRSGELVLPSQTFTGRQRDPATGSLRFLRAQSEPKSVEVLPPPADFPGDRWIAAESLMLDEDWSSQPDTLQVGESLTRTITLHTLGLLKSALPQLSVDYPEQFNVYPEPPSSEAEINTGTIEAIQTQTTALVAVKPGEAVFPEIRVHWWDTLNEQPRVAVIPARTLTVLPAPGANQNTESSAPADLEPENESQDSIQESVPAPAMPGTDPFFSGWRTALTVFFAAAWIITLALWLRRRSAEPEVRPAQAGDTGLAALKAHALNGDVKTFQQLPAWVRARFGRPDIHTLSDTRNFFADPELDQALSALERYHFSEGSRGTSGWTQGAKLVAVLERLNRQAKHGQADRKALPPFRKVST